MRARVFAATTAATLAILTAVLGAAPAAFAADGVWAQWTLDGSHQAYTGTMTLGSTFPDATYTSDSRAPASIASGNTTWLSDGTPPGAAYGSSQGEDYLLLRPAADNPSSPSTTTFTFAAPTPASGWAFVVGDVDADEVKISATDAAGRPVPVAGLGFRSVFNFCENPPKPAACSGTAPPYDYPTWDPATGTLHGHDESLDTTGAAAWFQPNVPLASLTFTFTQKSGFPVYQLWFVRDKVLPTPGPTVQPTGTWKPNILPVTGAPVHPAVFTLVLGLALIAVGTVALWRSRRTS